MKSFGKKLTAVLLALPIVMTSAQARGEDCADRLYEMGLFKGTDVGYELEKELTREESAALLVRLYGEESGLSGEEYEEEFEDVSRDRWSFPYVMYCYENGITKGTGENTFSPAYAISAEQFVTLVLRLLGYEEASPEDALNEAVEKRLINSQEAQRLKENDVFLRGDAVYIMDRCLMTETEDGTILAEELLEKGVITKAQAEEFDLEESEMKIDDLIDRMLG